MAKAISASVLLSVLLFFSCSIGYDITERIGGDVTGFSMPAYTTRFYSDSEDDFTVQTMFDTIIDNQNYKEVYFNSTLVLLLYSEQYIYRRFEFAGTDIVAPFLNQVVIEGMKDYKKSENSIYSYEYNFRVDSLKSLAINDALYDNCYFVTTSVKVIKGDADTSFINKYALTHEDGIIGIFFEDSFMLLDSIVSN